jgi:hypothetical protein
MPFDFRGILFKNTNEQQFFVPILEQISKGGGGCLMIQRSNVLLYS